MNFYHVMIIEIIMTRLETTNFFEALFLALLLEFGSDSEPKKCVEKSTG